MVIRRAIESLREEFDVTESVDDAGTMIIAAVVGAVSGNFLSGGTNTLELIAFMTPSFVILVGGLMLFKAVVRATAVDVEA